MERKAKRLAVKEYAVDNGYNPKLLARLVNISDIEIDDEGDIDEDQLAEVIDDVIEEFRSCFNSPMMRTMRMIKKIVKRIRIAIAHIKSAKVKQTSRKNRI